MLELTVLDRVPDGLLDCEAQDLHTLLGGPTLIHLPGRQTEPLFLSVLLHGNETTGFGAAREVLRRHRGHQLPRALSLFIGNVAAAAEGLRRLEGQPDYNRVWPGANGPASAETKVMRRVRDVMKARAPFASIDIHNNTGHNPHYACVNALDGRYFHLALLFSRTVVYFEKPLGVQSAAFAPFCPAVTVECGMSGVRSGADHAAEFVEAALHLSHIPERGVAPHDIDLLQTYAIVKVPEQASFSFDGSAADIRFRGDIDHLNFSEIDPGTSLGRVSGERHARLEVLPGDGAGPIDDPFAYADGEIRFARRTVPAMLSRDPDVVRQDCLCYLMRRIDLPPPD